MKLTEQEIKQIKNLEIALAKLIDASRDVDMHCGDYCVAEKEQQDEYYEMLEFIKMQATSRCGVLIDLIGVKK